MVNPSVLFCLFCVCIDDGVRVWVGPWRGFKFFSLVEGLSFRAFSSRGSSLMQSIAETCVCFDAAHLSINLVSEISVPKFPTLIHLRVRAQ